ncbi:MAG: HAMP domain-containing protein [Xanthobacteraceae bacterium]|nr:HAMP domain-containing protein [Xanthobacteraceae bacterium]
MIGTSIKRQIMGIAVCLIILMAAVSIMSMYMVNRGEQELQKLTEEYVPSYGNLARANVYSLERGIALRNMIIDKLQFPSDAERFAHHRKMFDDRGAAFEKEVQSARGHISTLLQNSQTIENSVALTRVQNQIDSAVDDQRQLLNREIARLLSLLETADTRTAADSLSRIDELREALTVKLDGIRSSMMALVNEGGEDNVKNQQDVMIIVAILTVLAALLGFVFSIMVSGEVTRPVQRLLAGTRNVEAGNLNDLVEVTSRNEIGDLTAAFNRMIEQLRLKERIRETFGKYIDPRVVAGLIDKSELAVADGERRIMTVLFCDMKGFTQASQQMTPQGLVKVMNRYLSIMSEPIHDRHGIIDKYIGDAIMAYWGPPFTDSADHARFGCQAALDMINRVSVLRAELPDLLGVRNVPVQFDMRIGIATGEVLVGSIGSRFMMSYTVMGDTVNLASRLEGLNKIYNTHLLVSEATMSAAGDVEAREIDRVMVAGQTTPQSIFEIMAPKGELSSAQLSLRENYAEGLAAYRKRNWDDAARKFAAALDASPADGPSMTLLKRVKQLAAEPPADNWNGVWQIDEK